MFFATVRADDGQQHELIFHARGTARGEMDDDELEQLLKKVRKKNAKQLETLGVVVGKPLPQKGACKHYKLSHRWLRFPCCARAYPCAVCHELDVTLCRAHSHFYTFLVFDPRGSPHDRTHESHTLTRCLYSLVTRPMAMPPPPCWRSTPPSPAAARAGAR